MKKIWTFFDVAKAFGSSKQWIHQLWQEGRLKHDIEDQEGRQYFSRLPKRPPALPLGKPKKKEIKK